MGNLCTRRELSKQYTSNNSRHQYNSYFSLGQNNQFNSIKIIYQKIKDAIDINHPSIQLQDQIFQAKESNDIKTLTDLMNCDDPVAYEITTQHPWCLPPQTIGSVAIMYISALIINESQMGESDYLQQNDLVKKNIDLIKKQKVIEILLNNLNHKDKDRQQLSILLLAFLVDDEQFVNQINQKQGFDKIVPLLYQNDDNCLGFRVSVGYICKELFTNQGFLVEKFVNDNKAMISLLNFIDENDYCINIEGLNILERLIDFQNYSVQQKQTIVNQIKKYEFLDHLQKQLQYLQLQNERADQDISIDVINDRNYAIQMINVLTQRLTKI